MSERPKRCTRRGCRVPLEQPRTGRPRVFCSDRCRVAVWEAKQRRSVHFRSDTNQWYTPVPLFLELADRYGPFDLDPAADPRAPIWPLVPRRFTALEDGLEQPWEGRVWLNPPYGRAIGRWTSKAASEVAAGRAELVVGLVPARTDTRWWAFAGDSGAEVEYLRGRVRFVRPDGTVGAGAGFPSAVLVFRKEEVLTKLRVVPGG